MNNVRTQHVILYQALLANGLPLDVRRLIMRQVRANEEVAREKFYETRIIPMKGKIELIAAFRQYLHILVDDTIAANKARSEGRDPTQYIASAHELMYIVEWEAAIWDQDNVPEEDRHPIVATTAKLTRHPEVRGNMLLGSQLMAYTQCQIASAKKIINRITAEKESQRH